MIVDCPSEIFSILYNILCLSIIYSDTNSPTVDVWANFFVELISGVVILSSIDFSTALLIASASSYNLKCSSKRDADNMVAKGLAMFFPFIFGKDP